MPQDDVPGDGKTQAVAAPLGVCLVDTIEALENVLQVRLGDLRTGVGHCQTAPPAAAGEGDGDLAGGRGVFPGVVQKNVYRLPQMLLAAPDSDIFLNVRSEGVARFKKYRLKGEDRIADQTAQVHL